MKAETKRKLELLMELGLSQNEINELMDAQNLLDESHDFEKIKENDIIEISETLYERGYSALDLIEYIKELKIDEIKKYEYLVFFQKIKREFREERLLMACMLHFVLKRLDYSLENISFM